MADNPNNTAEAVPSLKLCPWCGELPQYVRSERNHATLDEALMAEPDVKCRTPKCPVRFFPTAFTQAEWNTRAEIAATPEPKGDAEAMCAEHVTDAMIEAGNKCAPCPTCKQFSHSVGEDQLAEAYMHFESMYAHPSRGHPMGHNFDDETREAAQVLMAAARSSLPPVKGTIVGGVHKVKLAILAELMRVEPDAVARELTDEEIGRIATAAIESMPIQRMVDGLEAALEMVVELDETGTYSVSEYNELRSLLASVRSDAHD